MKSGHQQAACILEIFRSCSHDAEAPLTTCTRVNTLHLENNILKTCKSFSKHASPYYGSVMNGEDRLFAELGFAHI